MNHKTIQQDMIKILLVEDEAVIAISQKAILESLNFQVNIVNSGEKAIEYIKNIEIPNIILMDIDLGLGMDGVQTSEEILNIQEIPIIFVTSRTEPEFLERTENISAYGYLAKLNNANIFNASIKVALRLFATKKAMELKEMELIKSQERYKALVEWSPNPICIHSEGKILFANLALQRLLKAQSFYELENKNISEFIHPEYKEIIQSRIQSMDVEYKEVKPKFEKFICLDGSIVDVVVRGIKVFFDGKSSVLAYIQESS